MAVTPENRVIALHVAFTVWAWRLVPVVAAILGFSAIKAGPSHRRAGITWLVTAVLLACYAGALTWGVEITDPRTLAAYVIAQKVATLILTGAFLSIAADADRARQSLARAGGSPEAIAHLTG